MKHIYIFETFNGNETKVDEGLIKTEPFKQAIYHIELGLMSMRLKFNISDKDFDNNKFNLELDDFLYNDSINCVIFTYVYLSFLATL